MDTLFGLIEEEIEEPDKVVFQNARVLLRDSSILADALNPSKILRLRLITEGETPDLSEWVLQDDVERGWTGDY